MTTRLTLALCAAACLTTASAQTAITTAEFEGTWNIELMSHQIALVIAPKDDTHVTATMMMMGRDVALKGELKDRTLTLVGDKTAAPQGEGSAAPATAEGHGPGPMAAGPRPIVVTLQPDGTITGDLMTQQGPATFTGEKLRKRK